MAELKNTFSWSYSAADDFQKCPRKRYWSKYGMWGGWDRNASAESKAAYRLNKMDNFYSVMGQAAEDSVMWAFEQMQGGKTVTVDEVYDAVAKPMLNRCWSDSLKEKWRDAPKQFCCLREHYFKKKYGGADPGGLVPRVLDDDEVKRWTVKISDQVKTCIRNFIDKVYPRISHVQSSDIVSVARVRAGDPESFEYEGVKIYAIPDFAYVRDGVMFIHDWKSGKPRESHMRQVTIYGLWAVVKHGFKPENVRLFLEYLAHGEFAERRMTDEDVEAIRGEIENSVADMSMYLKDNDRLRNSPVPRDEWDLTDDISTCRECNFFELCEKELKELGVGG